MCCIIHQKQSSDKKALSDFYHRPLLLAYSRRHRHRPFLLPMPSIPTSFTRIHEYFLVNQKRIVFCEHKRCIVFFSPLLFVILFFCLFFYTVCVCFFVLLIDAVCFYCSPLNMRIISVEQRWRWDYDNDSENTNRLSVWETFCLPLLLLLLLLLTFVRHKIYLGASLFLALRHQWHTMCATRINTL